MFSPQTGPSRYGPHILTPPGFFSIGFFSIGIFSIGQVALGVYAWGAYSRWMKQGSGWSEGGKVAFHPTSPRVSTEHTLLGVYAWDA